MKKQKGDHITFYAGWEVSKQLAELSSVLGQTAQGGDRVDLVISGVLRRELPALLARAKERRIKELTEQLNPEAQDAQEE